MTGLTHKARLIIDEQLTVQVSHGGEVSCMLGCSCIWQGREEEGTQVGTQQALNFVVHALLHSRCAEQELG